jgi:hypothetical protein
VVLMRDPMQAASYATCFSKEASRGPLRLVTLPNHSR